jgi:hypothetical protein
MPGSPGAVPRDWLISDQNSTELEAPPELPEVS